MSADSLPREAESYLRRLGACPSRGWTRRSAGTSSPSCGRTSSIAARRGGPTCSTGSIPPEAYAARFLEESMLSKAVVRGSSLQLWRALLLGVRNGAETLLVVLAAADRAIPRRDSGRSRRAQAVLLRQHRLLPRPRDGGLSISPRRRRPRGGGRFRSSLPPAASRSGRASAGSACWRRSGWTGRGGNPECPESLQCTRRCKPRHLATWPVFSAFHSRSGSLVAQFLALRSGVSGACTRASGFRSSCGPCCCRARERTRCARRCPPPAEVARSATPRARLSRRRRPGAARGYSSFAAGTGRWNQQRLASSMRPAHR